ncbi:MAG: hypothetical protein M0R80_00320 [Proteobacteria bacterium]|jgi:hypothetical protein|nr:hypothetical protein [Pseudomonadota bacterium]
MTALFVVIVLAIFAGGVCMWLSGMFFGRRARPDASRAAETADQLRADRARLDEALATATVRIAEAEEKAAQAEETKRKAEVEVGRAATELGRVAGEMTEAGEEIARLKQEAEELGQELERFKQAARTRVKPPPLPTRAGAVDAPESPDLDLALAQLDMERVAHKKTRDELEQLKGGGPVQISDGRSSVPPAPAGFGVPGRRGAGFQTVSIASRGQAVPASDHDRLRQSNDQLQREKERIEAELARAQQELQLLKMRKE